MSRQRRSNILVGLLLILAGGWLLAQQFYPELQIWNYFNFSWPWYVIGAGVGLLLLGLLFRAPGMAVPAAIVGGVGAILYYQNETGNWESWSYAWSLIPGFVGVGILLANFLEGKFREGLRSGGFLIIISAVLFLIFGSFVGDLRILSKYWPVILILVGVWFLVQPWFDRSSKKHD